MPDFTVIGREGAAWSPAKFHRIEGLPTVYNNSTGASYPDLAAAVNANGAIDVEVRRPTTATTTTPNPTTGGTNTGGGIMDSKVTLPVFGEVPVVGVVVAAIAAYFVFVD